MCDERAELEDTKLKRALFSGDSFSTVKFESAAEIGPSDRLPVLGDYELIKPLGQGGMGTVYLAKHKTLGRLVALKTIIRGSISGSQEIARFRAEAEAAAKLDHPNIASIYEIGECNGTHFISMQLIDGVSLDAWRKQTLPSPKTCTAIVRDLAFAMSYAHAQSVIHRDLKPGNVMIDDSGAVRIVDFGLAKRLDSESQMTMTGQIMGTPSFMAPEQAAGDSKNVTALADVYAIGAILFYLLTGRPPFTGTTVYDTLDRVQHAPAPSVRTINRRLPLDLSTICAKCLEKNPAKRYASANELAEDLARFLNHQPVLARRITTSTRVVRWCRRNPLATVFMVVTTTMLSATTYLYIQADRAVADARRSFQRQVLTINDLLVQIGSSDLKNIPNSQAIRRELLQKAEAFYAETRQSRAQFQSIDDLFVQSATQLALVQGELATTPLERNAALQKLREAERALITLLEEERLASSLSIDDALTVYGLNPEMRQWWDSVRPTVTDGILLQSMRRSALTDNLAQQLHLLVDYPESQVEIAHRMLAIRSQLSATLPNDRESKRRLAGAHHNLAEAYRKLSEKTGAADDLRRSVEHLELAQNTRRQLLISESSEKIRFEIAKGDYALGSTRYATRFAEASAATKTESPISNQAIEDAFLRAQEGFASLAESKSYSLESLFSQAIVLRELSVLGVDDAPVHENDFEMRQAQAAKSCDLLARLSYDNPLVQKYEVELIRSQACKYRIARFRAPHGNSNAPTDAVYQELRTAMIRDLDKAKALAREYPATFLVAYLTLAKEVCLEMLQLGFESDSLQTCSDAKSVIDSVAAVESSPALKPLLDFVELAIEELRLAN